MKGDFSSSWKKEKALNFRGTLHQQGRVETDRDWNAQTNLVKDWQEIAGRDILGACVAAVPSNEPESFKITKAEITNPDPDRIEVLVNGGRVWADGLLIELNEDKETPDKTFEATYLDSTVKYPLPPLNSAIRDAVILEAWNEEINAFQMPELLIEPALGGVDTTERIHTAFRFRLFRLDEGQTCDSISGELKADLDQRGKLSVVLQPEETSGDDECPVFEGGGYTGFEHQLYRIEIAKINNDAPLFKWSQFNGGLVGRGRFDPAGKFSVKHNQQAIIHSGLDKFYLEVVQPADGGNYWTVTYGAEVILNGSDLEVQNVHLDESIPPTDRDVFYRLWNGIEEIQTYAGLAEPKELRDGIRLDFEEPVNPERFVHGDFWTFQVRAGEITNDEILIGSRMEAEGPIVGETPEGIYRHRVPLAELKWDNNKIISFEEGGIEDCRRIFRPLTNQKICCSYTVGDGKSTHGDFDSIEEAVRHLPDTGGEICLLPGEHEANVLIEGKENIKISGCDKNTLVSPRESNLDDPIFQIVDSQCITLKNMDLATGEGTTIVVTESNGIDIHHNRILSGRQAIRVQNGTDINIHNNNIRLLDLEDGDVAIYISAKNSVIEQNEVSVIPPELKPPTDDIPENPDNPDPFAPCADLNLFFRQRLYFAKTVRYFLQANLRIFFPNNPSVALGGIQIAAGSENLKILRNQINGGAGNGITLGSGLDDLTDRSEDSPPDEEIPVIKSKHRGVWGNIMFGGNFLKRAGVQIRFEDKEALEDHIPLSTITNSDGGFLVRGAKEEVVYEVFVTGFKIERIEERDQDSRVQYLIHVVEAADKVDLSEIFAPISDVAIDGNEITNMGGSGIGIPSVDLLALNNLKNPEAKRFLLTFIRQFGFLGFFVVNLSIHRNHIFNCLQNAFERKPLPSMNRLGAGGVSLGFCINLLIDQNRFEDNGRNHSKPVCGLFVFYVDGINLSHNRIINNGLSNPDPNAFRQGPRGGLVLRMATALKSKNAVQIQDNVIEQPLGRALTITAFGPVSVVNNQLNSDAAEIPLGQRPDLSEITAKDLWIYLNTNAGTVLILNFGTNAPGLPGGNTLFNSNQVWLGKVNANQVSIAISSSDDIGFDGNQSDILKNQDLPPRAPVQSVNTFLSASTLRAGDSRFKEPIDRGLFTPGAPIGRGHWLSLLTLSRFMNTTTQNQGNHCIIVINGDLEQEIDREKEIDRDNSALTAQREFCQGKKFAIHKFFNSLLKLAKQTGWSQPVTDEQNSLGALKDIQVQSHFLFQYEARRLRREFGQDHPRTQQIEESLRKNQNLIKDLEIELEIAKIRVPEVGQDDALIHGRIVDENQRGLAGLTVFAEDNNQKIIRSLGALETDSSGYYALSVKAEDLDRLREIAKGGIIITISSPSQKIIFRHAKPLQLVKGDRIEVGTALNRATLKPIRKDGKPSFPDDSKAADEKNGKISPIPLEKIRGIGPATAKKLKAAKIADVKAFSEAKEEKLKEILKNVNISIIREMKKEAKTLLEQAAKKKKD